MNSVLSESKSKFYWEGGRVMISIGFVVRSRKWRRVVGFDLWFEVADRASARFGLERILCRAGSFRARDGMGDRVSSVERAGVRFSRVGKLV